MTQAAVNNAIVLYRLAVERRDVEEAQRVYFVTEKLAQTLAKTNKKAFIEKNIGKVHEVIIENQKNGYYIAHTKNYILNIMGRVGKA